ncbi:MAG: DUF2505 family protein [Candidatus Xenobia bacterium]
MEPLGDRCRRDYSGEVTCSLPFIGAAIETWVMDQLRHAVALSDSLVAEHLQTC